MSTPRTDVFTSTPQEGDLTQYLLGDVPFIIRTVRQQDLPSLADVLARSFHRQDGLMGWLYPIFRMGIYEDLRSRLRNKTPHYACLVAIANPSTEHIAHRLIGTIEISVRPQALWLPRYTQYPYLSNLAVETEYRRQGVAQHLLSVSERIALDWGYKDLYLHVLENNYKARRLYMKAGFRLHRIDANLGSYLLGQPRQLFLRKQLVKE